MRVAVIGSWEDRKEIATMMFCIEADGHIITHDWTKHYFSLDPTTKFRQAEQYAQEDLRMIRDCEVLVFYAKNNFTCRGSYVEMGAALALDKPIILYGHGVDACIYVNHPLVRRAGSALEVLDMLEEDAF